MFSNQLLLADKILKAIDVGYFDDTNEYRITFSSDDVSSDEFVNKEFCYNKFNMKEYFPTNTFFKLVEKIRDL